MSHVGPIDLTPSHDRSGLQGLVIVPVMTGPADLTRPGDAGLMVELAAAGYRFDHVFRIHSDPDKAKLRGAAPILGRWLLRLEDKQTQLGVVYGLTGAHGRPAAADLVAAFSVVTDEGLREAISVALGAMANPTMGALSPAIASAALDLRWGDARAGMAEAAGALQTPVATAAAVELLGDPRLGVHALRGLAKGVAKRSVEGVPREAVEPYLDSLEWPGSIVTMARKLVARIDAST